MILYMHGYCSSAQTKKANVLPDMVCHTVNYETESYEQVKAFYENIIENNDVKMIVGHSLGGYWALKMANKYQIPVVLVNPSLFPTIVDYPPCTEEDTVNRSHRWVYLEMGDDVLDCNHVYSFLRGNASFHKVQGGNHRIQYIDRMTTYINNCLNYILVG